MYYRLFHRPAGRSMVLALAALFLAACASDMRQEKADHNLTQAKPGYFDYVLMQPDQPLPNFTRVFITEPDVSMSRYWLRDHRNYYTTRDLERIKRDYSRFLKETLAQTLSEKSQIEIVDSVAAADMILRPSLRELNIYAPDLMRPGRIEHYIEFAGNATLDLEFVDPESERILAQFVDHRETPPIVMGQVKETNRVINNRLFQHLMQRWSNNLVKYLDDEGIVARR